MASSPSHKLGQLIGNLLEITFVPIFKDIANRNNLYLDIVGQSRAARKGKKISWQDGYGNSHDLDFVFEYDGSETKLGRPVAFIESAWRRYTKHSKNKAQEIQGAILPITDNFSIECPFKGAVLAGEFTKPSLKQLESCGFEVLYIPYVTIVNSFLSVGIDISFDEQTPESDLTLKVINVESLTQNQLIMVSNKIIELAYNETKKFTTNLEIKIRKELKVIIISPLYGHKFSFISVTDAKKFIYDYNCFQNDANTLMFNSFLIIVEYINGDHIKGEFTSKENAMNFLDIALFR